MPAAGSVPLVCSIRRALWLPPLESTDTLVLPLISESRARLADDAPKSHGEDTAGGIPWAALDSFGDYELLEEIARGGMGVIYKARQKSLGRLVAVKLILAGQFAGKQIAQRFKSEAIAAAVLHHPNIVAVHEVGVHQGHHFFSMDYVEGRNLAQLVAQRPLRPQEAARYVKLIAEAIHYAHGQGILHRDLKPSNVLIDAATDQPRVSDFGLAKRLDGESSLTITGEVLGSPHFMPPEQASAGRGKVGRTSDVFGLGGVLYFLITARAPFQGETLETTIEQVLHAQPVSPRLLNPTLPRDLETICLKCLEKAPERRYQSAHELADELGRFIRNEPVLARPVSQLEKVWRWCLRKPLVAGLSATTLALLVAVAIGAPIALYQINQDQARARALMAQLRIQSYASDMKEASLALEEQNRGAAQELIQKHLPKADQDLRGLEWRYLWTLLRGDELASLRSHRGGVREVVFSPDGHLLASSGLDQTVRIWEVSSGKALKKLQGVTDQNLHQSIAFAPDGSALAVASGGRINLWRTSDWQPLRQPLTGATGTTGVTAPIVFSPDGKILAARSGGELMLWDTTNWKMASLKAESNQGVRGCLAIAPDNRLLALAFAFGAPLQLWDLAARAKVNQIETVAASLAFGPNGTQLAIGVYETGQVRLLDSASGKFIASSQIGETNISVFGVAFSPEGKMLATAVGPLIHLHDLPSARKRATLKGHHAAVHSLAHSPAAPLLASAGMDGTIKLWSTEPAGPTNVWDARSDIDLLSPGRNRQRLCSWAADGLLQFWDIIDGRLTPAFALPSDEEQPGRFAKKVQCSPDGSYAAYGTADGQVNVYDSATGRVISSLRIGESNVRAAAFSPDNKWLLTAEEGDASLTTTQEVANATLWNWRTKQVEARLDDVYCSVLDLPVGTFSPDGRLLAYVAQGYTVNLWDSVTKQVCWKLKGHDWLVCALNFSPDGRLLATSSFDGSTRVWDLATGRPSSRKLNAESHLLWFSRDSRTLVAAGDPSVRFLNVTTGQETLAIRNATGALLSPDDTALVLWRREGVSLMRIPTCAEIDAMETEH